MSIDLIPFKVDWPAFLRSFPVPDPPIALTTGWPTWLLDTETDLEWSDDHSNIGWTTGFEIMRKQLPWPVILAIEPFVQTTSVYGIRTRRVKFNQFTPPCKYLNSDFPGDGGGMEIFPAMSPGAIVDVLAYLDSLPRNLIVDELRRAWDKTSNRISKDCRFESFNAYMRYFDNWDTILREVKTRNHGFRISLCI